MNRGQNKGKGVYKKMDFSKIYQDAIYPIYKGLVRNYWTEEAYFDKDFCIESSDVKGALNSIFAEKMGGFNAKLGFFYEKRLALVSDCVNLYGNPSNMRVRSEFLKDSVNLEVFGEVPERVFELITRFVNDTYTKRGVNIEEFNKNLEFFWNTYLYECKKGSTISLKRRIDGLMVVTEKGQSYTYLIESKTKGNMQDDIAKGCLKRIIESWILLNIMDYQKGEFVSWDKYRILIPLNGITSEKENDAFIYPKYSPNNPLLGGAIPIDVFYKFFFDVFYEELIKVEKEYSKVTDKLWFESILYCVSNLVKSGIMNKNDVQKSIHKYFE